MDKLKLSQAEQEIEDILESAKPVSQEKKKQINNILKQSKKDQTISLRLSSADLERIKDHALREGIPYQTLISSVLHKYVTHQLYDKHELIKTMKALKDIHWE